MYFVQDKMNTTMQDVHLNGNLLKNETQTTIGLSSEHRVPVEKGCDPRALII